MTTTSDYAIIKLQYGTNIGGKTMMKKFVVFFWCCVLSLILVSCGGAVSDTGVGGDTEDTVETQEETEIPPARVTVDALGALNEGETVILEAVVTGKVGTKIYVADETGALELTDLPFLVASQCSTGYRMEFLLSADDVRLTVKEAKKLSSNQDTDEAIRLSDLSTLNDFLYRKVCADGLTVVRIEGDLYDVESDARIIVSDGENEAALLIPSFLNSIERTALTKALNYPDAGDALTVSDVFVTQAEGAVIELANARQVQVTAYAGKVNIERLEKDIADISVDVGGAYRYTPKTYPANATNFSYVTYTVSDPSIAYMDGDGNICGKAYGKTFLHVEQTGGNKIVIPIYVEPKLELGFDKWSPTKVDETRRSVSNLEELRAAFLDAALNGYREIYVDFNLSKPIYSSEINRLTEYKYLTGYPMETVIGGDSTNVYTDELVKFTFCGWEGETMYGPYEIPTEQSGVNFIDAASVLRQKYVIESSPYKRSETFEDFPITKSNEGTIAVYNPFQLVWALEYNRLPTFPLENSKAEYIYEQAKDILRSIITDDMTEVQKCKAIFDYICQNAVYAVDYYGRTEDGGYYAPEQSLIGFFERGRVVCEGYMEVFVLLARMEGIEAYRITGDMQKTRSDGHAWNAVVLDGKWYEICATQSDNTMRGWPDNWFDEEAQGGGHDTHSYRHFLVDNQYFAGAYPYQNTPEDAEFSNVYDVHLIDKLPNKDFDYVIESAFELEKVLREVLALGLEGNYYISLSFRGVELSFDILDPMMKKLGYKGEYTYTTPQESLNGKDVFQSIVFHTVNSGN